MYQVSDYDSFAKNVYYTFALLWEKLVMWSADLIIILSGKLGPYFNFLPGVLPIYLI